MYIILAIFTVILPSSFAAPTVAEAALDNGVEHLNLQQPTG